MITNTICRISLGPTIAVIALAAGCGAPDDDEPITRRLPGFCVETYTRSDPGDLGRELRVVYDWEDDRLTRDRFFIDGDLWGEATYFYDADGRIEYRIDLGERVDYTYEEGRLVETTSAISRVEFTYDDQGQKAAEYYYTIDEAGVESFDRATVFRYDGSTVEEMFDNDMEHDEVGGGTHFVYRTDAHEVLEREEVYDSDGDLTLTRTYDHDEYGNRLSAVVDDLVDDDRNLQGDIVFDYSCF